MGRDSGIGLLALGAILLFALKPRKLNGLNGNGFQPWGDVFNVVDIEDYTEAREEAQALLAEIRAFRATLPDVPPRPISTGRVRTFKLPPGGRIVLKRGPMATGPLPKGYVLPSP
ncbi:unnamed protein product, partial [marine sediment metagenome]